MLKRLIADGYNGIRKIFKTEDSRFIMAVGLKVTFISFTINLFIYFFLFQILRINHAFFKAHGFPDFQSGSPFYDAITGEALDNLPILFLFHIVLFFVGVYVGRLLLRPFRTIGDYCENTLNDPNYDYRVEAFSNYSLLTRFSELFFEYLRDSREKKELLQHSIPPQFSKIHKPVQDKVFMLHFGLLLIVISIISAVFIIQSSSAIYTKMVELAMTTLPGSKGIHRYLTEQTFILDDLVNMTIVLVIIFYTVLGVHLYSKVSGAAFGIFSTMRSFMKGNHTTRVHLIGYAYIRDHTRKLNKYLDYIHNNYVKDKRNG